MKLSLCCTGVEDQSLLHTVVHVSRARPSYCLHIHIVQGELFAPNVLCLVAGHPLHNADAEMLSGLLTDVWSDLYQRRSLPLPGWFGLVGLQRDGETSVGSPG